MDRPEPETDPPQLPSRMVLSDFGFLPGEQQADIERQRRTED
jgi:hypothetical protein